MTDSELAMLMLEAYEKFLSEEPPEARYSPADVLSSIQHLRGQMKSVMTLTGETRQVIIDVFRISLKRQA